MMKIIRSILIGLMIGGGIGAKTGSYLVTISNETASGWSWISGGLIIGAIVGLLLSLVVLMATSSISFRIKRSKSFEYSTPTYALKRG